MTTFASTQLGSEDIKELTDTILNAVNEGQKQAVHMFWSALLSFIAEHWLLLMILFLIIFVVAMVKTIFGRWGMLGSILYNFFYFGILFIIGLIWGPEIFINNIFGAACAIILYPVCYFLVGLILDKTGVHRW